MSLLALMLGLTISLPEGKKQKPVSKAVKAGEAKKDAGKQESSLSQVSAPEIGATSIVKSLTTTETEE